MAKWQDVFALVLQGKDAVAIAAELKVKPSRLRKLMYSPRLAEWMEVTAELSARLARWDAAQKSRDAVAKLVAILGDGDARPETARKAAMALLRLAREAEKDPAGSSGATAAVCAAVPTVHAQTDKTRGPSAAHTVLAARNGLADRLNQGEDPRPPLSGVPS